jgi:hypothetical protein
VRRAIDSRKGFGHLHTSSMRYGGALVTAFGDRIVGCFGDSSVVFGLLVVERADLGPR